MNASLPLRTRVRLATSLMWFCGMLIVGPVVYTVFRQATAADDDEFMAVTYTLFSWGMVLLFPLLGFGRALDWRRTLERELRKLENPEANRVA